MAGIIPPRWGRLGRDDRRRPARRAARFLALHTGSRILVLPHAWDGGSARVFEQAGFPALRTTSAGIAISLGYPDGKRNSRDAMIVARVSVGFGPMRAAFALTHRIARRMKDEDTFTAFTDDTVPLREVNRLVTR